MLLMMNGADRGAWKSTAPPHPGTYWRPPREVMQVFDRPVGASAPRDGALSEYTGSGRGNCTYYVIVEAKHVDVHVCMMDLATISLLMRSSVLRLLYNILVCL